MRNNNLALGILGYGRMGHEVAEAAERLKYTVICTVDNNSEIDEKRGLLEKCDVLIDFSVSSAVIPHIELACEIKKPIVIGTTGWYSDIGRAKNLIEQCGNAAVYGSNFSIGMNLFIKSIEDASAYFGRFPEYDCAVVEVHHNQKADAPSGTALAIAESIIKNFPNKKQILNGIPKGKILPEELQVNSIRVGGEFGTHTVIFDSENEKIEFTHTSRGRKAFASGAILAAEWVFGKTGFHQFKDVLQQILKGQK
ncbi:MAG: 4-hydroxy-tetrahydrodipicolinate reductase [Candidatus Kryptoniota bacterium]